MNVFFDTHRFQRFSESPTLLTYFSDQNSKPVQECSPHMFHPEKIRTQKYLFVSQNKYPSNFFSNFAFQTLQI